MAVKSKRRGSPPMPRTRDVAGEPAKGKSRRGVTPAPTRDFVGYGRHPPHPRWPGDARIAVNFNLNVEAGGEHSILEGDASPSRMECSPPASTLRLKLTAILASPGHRGWGGCRPYPTKSRVGAGVTPRLDLPFAGSPATSLVRGIGGEPRRFDFTAIAPIKYHSLGTTPKARLGPRDSETNAKANRSR